MLYKLAKLGIGKQCYNVVKSMFSNIKKSIKFKLNMSIYFKTTRGVQQGDSLSPTLFNIYINDIIDIFEENSDKPEPLGQKIPFLMFADDIILMSTTKKGLQNSINKLADYTERWELEINSGKTKCMVFTNGTSPCHEKLFINDIQIDNVDKSTYLGIDVNYRGNYKITTDRLYKKISQMLSSMEILYEESE